MANLEPRLNEEAFPRQRNVRPLISKDSRCIAGCLVRQSLSELQGSVGTDFCILNVKVDFHHISLPCLKAGSNTSRPVGLKHAINRTFCRLLDEDTTYLPLRGVDWSIREENWTLLQWLNHENTLKTFESGKTYVLIVRGVAVCPVRQSSCVTQLRLRHDVVLRSRITSCPQPEVSSSSSMFDTDHTF